MGVLTFPSFLRQVPSSLLQGPRTSPGSKLQETTCDVGDESVNLTAFLRCQDASRLQDGITSTPNYQPQAQTKTPYPRPLNPCIIMLLGQNPLFREDVFIRSPQQRTAFGALFAKSLHDRRLHFGSAVLKEVHGPARQGWLGVIPWVHVAKYGIFPAVGFDVVASLF